MDLKNTAVRVGKAAGTKAVPVDSGVLRGKEGGWLSASHWDEGLSGEH